MVYTVSWHLLELTCVQLMVLGCKSSQNGSFLYGEIVGQCLRPPIV